MSQKSALEVKQERIAAMGQDLGSLFDSLYNEIVFIKMKWIEFTELYGTNEKRIDVMNRSASWLFYILQKVLFQDILLGLSKITDPAGTGKTETVSIRALSALIVDPKLKNEVLKSITLVLKSTEFCRDWRNRVIAHKDRQLFLNTQVAEPLKEANRKKVNEAIKCMEDLIHIIEGHYLNSGTAFQLISSDKGALSLLYLLNDGFKYRAALDKQLKDIEDSL